MEDHVASHLAWVLSAVCHGEDAAGGQRPRGDGPAGSCGAGPAAGRRCDNPAVIPAWAAPDLTGYRRLPMHSLEHPDRLVLDGRWRFQLLRAPGDPVGPDWAEAVVPSLWTMAGTWDHPHYTNVQMPFAGRPPEIPELNPTGVYEREFEVPDAWAGRRVVLHVGAAESVLIVALNGVEIGVGKDSHLASEFDLTALLRPGSNTLTLRVVKWSDATYIEDQDQWWHGGISRSVFVYTTGQVYLADVKAIAGLDAGPDGRLTTGTLDLTVDVGFARRGLQPGWSVNASLAGLGVEVRADAPAPAGPANPDDPASRSLARRHAVFGPGALTADEATSWSTLFSAMAPVREGTVRWHLSIPSVQAWNAETPALHPLTVTLRAPDGEVAETAALRIGFRRVEIVGRDLLINGQRVFIRGVNRHDFDQHTGRVVSAEAMRADLVTMKQFGFNAVRTSHYPNDPAFLDLADELGLYVVDEADIESHAFQSTLCDDPRYLSAWVERVARMVQRDKHHASVIAWSLGNESGHGANHDAAAAWGRRYDPSRPLHYEGAIRWDWTADQPLSDIICPMYPEIEAIVDHARSGLQRHPLIMCEFSHAMGNSNGTLAEYWDAIESTPGLQGGFIWEFGDHGLVQDLPDGRQRWAYGGDFGDEPHDGNFVMDGMVWPDRRPKPAMWEHRRLAAPVRIAGEGTDLANGRIELSNHQHFRDLAWLRASYDLSVDGETIAADAFALPPIGPGERAIVQLPGWVAPVPGSGEVWLTVRVVTAAAEAWAPEGFEVCAVQLPVGSMPGETPLVAAADGSGVTTLDPDGRLVHPLFTAPPALTLWRAPTDNDRIGGMAARWTAAGVDQLTRRLVGIDRDGSTTVVRAEVSTSAGIVVAHEVRYTALEGGGIAVAESVVIPAALDDLARVGTVVEVVPGHEALEWFGTGPHETYPDRRRSGLVGRWTSTVTDQLVPYVRPQENGGHADVRWLRLSDATGAGLRIDLDRARQVSATHVRAADLAAATHDVDVVPCLETIVVLDAAHRGLGTASCGPDTLPAYRLGPGTYRWGWTLRGTAPA